MKKSSIIISNDAQTVNFREIRMGNITPNILYRSSHPIKKNKQEKIVALLASSAKIAAVINLHDTNSGLKAKVIFAPWYNRLYESGRVITLGMDFNNTSDSYKKKFKKGLQFIIRTDAPWLIHCHAGVDRTGFVSMVLEAFMGASLDDVVNDYLASFNSGFESSICDETQKADFSTAMRILSAMSSSQTINEINLQSIAETYLRSTIGLSIEETELLKMKLEGKNLLTLSSPDRPIC